MRVSGRNPEQQIEKLAGFCAGTFIITLAISAYWNSSVRLLHLFEAIPFMVALAMGRNKFGYALGIASGAFWIWMATAKTSWMQVGFEHAVSLFRTGIIENPDLLMGAPAAIVSAGLIVFSLWAYLRLPNKAWTDAAVFVASSGFAVAFFVAIFTVFAPESSGLFQVLASR